MQTSAANDGYVATLQKLYYNTAGVPVNETLVTTLLAYILDAQGGPFQPDNSGDTEWRLWSYILQNQCGPRVWSHNDTLDTLMAYVLYNMGGNPAANDTKVTLAKKMVNLQLALTNCYQESGLQLLFSGGQITTFAGGNLVLF